MNRDEFKKIIKKYSTIDLIKYCSNLSIEMFDKKKSFRIVNLPFYYRNGVKARNSNFIYHQAEIVNLIYLSVLYGNDYKKLKIDNYSFVNILNDLKKYKNDLSGKDDNIAKRYREFFAILANEQFDFQKIYSFIDLFNRLCFIFNCINAKYKEHPEYIDFELEIKKLTGMGLSDYIEMNLFLTILVIASKSADLTDLINKKPINIDNFRFDYVDLNTFIENNSFDYSYFRTEDKGTENWNILKYAPLIKVDKNNHIFMSNIYCFIISFSTRIYWLIRNKYKNLGLRKFTSYFGYCFEMYFKELLDYYKLDNYEKIEESNDEKPDWLIKTNDYNIVVEQKSTLFTIGSRESTLENKYKEIEKFIKVVKKGMSQLNNYKVDNDKVTLRLCLTFEEVNCVESIQDVVLDELNPEEKELFWLINISEFERLIYLMTNDYEEFKMVINKKIQLERKLDNNGRSFDVLLPKENDFIDNKINYYDKITQEILSKLKN